MKMKTFALMAAMIIGIVCSVWLFAGALTSGKGKMSGTVMDKETGQPLEGVTVKLFFPEVNQFHKPFPKTDKEGKWKALYVRKGLWNLDFEKSGYEPKKISFFVDPSPGTKNPSLDVALKKMEGPAVADTVVKEIESAKTLIVEKHYDKALKKLHEIVETHKEDPGIDIVYLYVGNCYGAKNDYGKAIEYYKKSLDKFPRHKDLLLSIGNAYNNLKDYPKAMEYFKKLSIDDIGNTDTLYNIGAIAYNDGDFETSAKYFKKATEINPQFADAFYQLGMTLTGLNKQQEAIAALEKFIELAPDSPNAATAKAVIDAFKETK
jgi:tetratricopeptide (TPR) repeat protein